ncbi:MAG: hypothetical protein ABI772_12535 [Bacteroidota bacterium]
MKTRLLLSAIALTTFVQAQPIINSSVYPTAGTTVSFTQANSASVSEGSSGASQSWNFASLVPIGNNYSSDYISATGTPYISSFPGSNLVAVTDDGQGGFIYTYYTHSTSATLMNGFGYDSQ